MVVNVSKITELDFVTPDFILNMVCALMLEPSKFE